MAIFEFPKRLRLVIKAVTYSASQILVVLEDAPADNTAIDLERCHRPPLGIGGGVGARRGGGGEGG